jgi:phosphoribosylglycinamide formyltransferase-1
MQKIAVLSSSEGLRFQSLIDSKKSGQLRAELVCLITDRADCGAAQKARASGIRVYYFDGREVDPKVYDEEVVATLDFFKVDWVMVDGYGRDLTPLLAERVEGRLIRLDSDESVPQFIDRISKG